MNDGLDIAQIGQALSVWALPVLIAITLHEAAHGWVAWRLGDDTAFRLGRVSFNPIRHVDLFGTVLIPAMMVLASGGRIVFGWAKPVPVNFGRLQHPKRDMVLVAAAGPGINIIIAIVAAFLINLVPLVPGSTQQWIALNLLNAVWINTLLAVFNMLPIPPLDGGRVLVGILPSPLSNKVARLERYGLMIVIAAAFVLPWLGGKLGMDLNILRWIVAEPAAVIENAILSLAGGAR